MQVDTALIDSSMNSESDLVPLSDFIQNLGAGFATKAFMQGDSYCQSIFSYAISSLQSQLQDDGDIANLYRSYLASVQSKSCAEADHWLPPGGYDFADMAGVFFIHFLALSMAIIQRMCRLRGQKNMTADSIDNDILENATGSQRGGGKGSRS